MVQRKQFDENARFHQHPAIEKLASFSQEKQGVSGKKWYMLSQVQSLVSNAIVQELYDNPFVTYIDVEEEGMKYFDQFVDKSGLKLVEVESRARKDSAELQNLYEQDLDQYCERMRNFVLNA